MGEWEHSCTGCKASHLAALWYYREYQTARQHVRERLCGTKHAELSDKEKVIWQLWES